MKWNLVIAIVLIIGTTQCANLGTGGDFAGGGVIGNPDGLTLTFSDTIKCKPENIIFLGNTSTQTGATPTGAQSGKLGQEQHYVSSGTTTTKRFRFAGTGSTSLSRWSTDSLVKWTWTTAGICTVQVQVEADTAIWSEPLIVDIQK
jgi:hypothetical protein